ncbi:MAG: hypothetical protein ABNH21_14325 [Glaciecola sp.]
MQNFKLGIVIPLKAKAVSQNWATVEDALAKVLSTINSQTSSNFECVVVGHDEPEGYNINELSINSSFVQFTEFSPPNQDEISGMELQLGYEFDRCSKIAKGMIYLNDKNVTHWFALDADDLLHKEFVATIERFPEHKAFVIDRGYFYFENNGILNEVDNLSLVCGSTCVINCALSSIPTKITDTSYRETFYGKIPHMEVKNHLAENHISYHIPKERLVVYIRDHGENISDYYFTNWIPRIKKWVKQRLKSQTLSAAEYQDLGIKK